MGPRALTVSVLAHVALLAAIAHGLGELDERPAETTDAEAAIAIEVVPPPPLPAAAPIEVALVEGGAPAAPFPTAPAAAIAASRPGATGSSTEAAGSTGPATSGGEPARPGALAMRGQRHDLALSGDTLSRILGDRPLPEPVQPTGHIQPAGREGRIVDPVATYNVHGDGTVDVVDKKDIDLHWRIPLPTPSKILGAVHAFGDDLQAWYADPYRDQRAGKWQDLPKHIQAIPGACDSFGDLACDIEQPSKEVSTSMSGDATIFGILGGRLDITGYLERKFVGDPYSSRKLKMLDDTRAERVERGTAFRAEQLGRSAELTARNLAALWRTTADPAARREALFELWDECAEGDGPAGVAGERARAMVIGWIRTHLPAGAPDAYTPAELASLDGKRASKQHFAPY